MKYTVLCAILMSVFFSFSQETNEISEPVYWSDYYKNDPKLFFPELLSVSGNDMMIGYRLGPRYAANYMKYTIATLRGHEVSYHSDEIKLKVNGKKMSFSDQFTFNGQMVVYSSGYTKGVASRGFQVFDKNTESLKTVLEITYSGVNFPYDWTEKINKNQPKNFYNNVSDKVYISDNDRFLLMFSYEGDKKAERIQIIGNVINEDYEVVSSEEMLFPDDIQRIEEMKLGNDGAIYALGELHKNGKYALFKKGLGESEFTRIDLEVNNIVNGRLAFLPDGNLMICGTTGTAYDYHSMSTDVFFELIDVALDTQVYVKKFFGDMEIPNTYEFSIKEPLVTSQGDVFLMGERQNVKYYKSTISPYDTTRTISSTENIFVFKLSYEDLEVSHTIIPHKLAYKGYEDHIEYGSYFHYLRDDIPYIIVNAEKNLNRISIDQSGGYKKEIIPNPDKNPNTRFVTGSVKIIDDEYLFLPYKYFIGLSSYAQWGVVRLE